MSCVTRGWAEVAFEGRAVESPRVAVPIPAGGAKVFVGLPCYGHVNAHAIPGLLAGVDVDDEDVAGFHVKPLSQSLLAYCFNGLVCTALNSQKDYGWTHFALHHADIEAPAGWIGTLVREMARVGADVLSAVVSIKDHRGVTSTGLRGVASQCTRRLTMKEIMRLPETFDAAAAGAKGDEILAVNTGLLLVRLGPWATQADANDCLPYRFSIGDAIKRTPEGAYVPIVVPEDWHFSTWAALHGLKVFATRKVEVIHWGEYGWGNQTPHGEWETERGDCNIP